MNPAASAFLTVMALATVAGVLLFGSAALCAWWEDYHDRRYPKSPEEVAWEEHVATTPGVLDVTDEGMQAFEDDVATPLPVIDFEGDAS